ncbi:hypothetical protein ACOMHN_031946 [Nucella lapillus]
MAVLLTLVAPGGISPPMEVLLPLAAFLLPWRSSFPWRQTSYHGGPPPLVAPGDIPPPMEVFLPLAAVLLSWRCSSSVCLSPPVYTRNRTGFERFYTK